MLNASQILDISRKIDRAMKELNAVASTVDSLRETPALPSLDYRILEGKMLDLRRELERCQIRLVDAMRGQEEGGVL